MRNSKRLAVRLPPELEKRLAVVAAWSGRSKASMARDAIIERLGDLETAYLPKKQGAARPGKKKAQRGSLA